MKCSQMRWFTALTASLLVAVALIGAATVSAAGSTVEVNAAAGWVQTSLWVQPGETVSLRAVGRAFTTLPAASTVNTYYPPNPGSGRAGESGPEGQVYVCTSYSGGTCAVENAPFGQLVGQVGGIAFPIGAATSFVVPATAPAGYLQLAVNDFVEWYFDNSGSYLINI